MASPPKAEAATCYTDLGNFSVEPTTHTCPSSGNATYLGTSGGELLGSFLASDRCFATRGTAQGGRPTYQEHTCANLESLRLTAAQAACEAEGGDFTRQTVNTSQRGQRTSSTTVDDCACPSTQVWDGNSCDLPDASSSLTEPTQIEDDCSGNNPQAGLADDDPNHCAILDYVVLAINLLSALVGIVVVGSIIYGGIQYSSAGSDPQKISAAKDRIRNALIALLFFIFTYSFLNYLIPGGVL